MKNSNSRLSPSRLRSEVLALRKNLQKQHALRQSNLDHPYPPARKTNVTSPQESTAPTDAQTANEVDANKHPYVVLTFADHLKKIDQFKGKYREQLYGILSMAYAACRAFKDAQTAEKATNQKILDDKCAALSVAGTSYYQQIVKITFSDDAKRASSFVHVIKVAESLLIEASEFITWLEDEKGIQQVRIKFKSDGSKKNQTPSTPTSTTQTRIDKAKAAISNDSLATIPFGQIPTIEKLGNEAEYSAIIRQQMDGSFTVKFVLNDSKMVNSIYAAHGRTLK